MRKTSEEENAGTLVSSKIKLNEDEYEDIINYITKIVKNKKENDGEDRKSYLFFTGIIESE
jgi:hypothetical protein